MSYRLENSRELLFDVNLSIAPGDVFMLLGRSGSGKTTALKLINRLLAPTQGEVRVDGISTMHWDPVALRRKIGYAIQEVGLFPHYTVEQNIALVPKLEHWPKEKIAGRVREVMTLLDLPADFLNRYPAQLSGGQRQRVGLARALAADPPILLMDEPFGALDPLSRVQLQKELRQLQQRLKKTVVFVTHDVGEALLLGDRIALLQEGRLLSIQTPKEFLATDDPNAKSYVEAFRSGYQVFKM
ncbi:MAG TPA: ATP-binding cassette domain-containing protein [Terriglobales bacterium]|nr:ATP-binding cassette domain-containing protein [Terriglobales bacterium]